MIALLADDITGAAESAGVGLRFGLRVTLATEAVKPACLSACDLLVVATDTRSMERDKAVSVSHGIAHELFVMGFRQFFKKIDSVLRGHVAAELRALMDETGFQRALCLPANPSRGRVTREGIYFINDIPLDRTEFRNDPEFPARTASVADILGQGRVTDTDTPIEGEGIFVGNASSQDDLDQYARRIESGVLPAGGADFFAAWLASLGHSEKPAEKFAGLQGAPVIVACGSTANHGIAQFPYVKRHDIPVCPMPRDLFEGRAEAGGWIDQLKETYRNAGSIIIAIGHPSEGGKVFAERLRQAMAQAITELMAMQPPAELIIEGGATVFETMHRLGWNRFEVTEEIIPGVVRLAPAVPGLHLTIKPGSYPWGDRLFR
ncbi:MAG: four-carbon acid sugar kinase family protein [Rikenellaceae bacterium]|jgi:uncharacterized protein YgbK (DUF1537 family)|nr:four-carbon acid sugar kinase family protein [Rikenellaceae bacterium]